ncbi:hypothetical protein [Photorhabdus khanii]
MATEAEKAALLAWKKNIE